MSSITSVEPSGRPPNVRYPDGIAEHCINWYATVGIAVAVVTTHAEQIEVHVSSVSEFKPGRNSNPVLDQCLLCEVPLEIFVSSTVSATTACNMPVICMDVLEGTRISVSSP